ncbi:variant erythrocyte surface antigen-1 family protein [Babesia caballi]|uniref:Variant erythrocyte surface antigen-1 family protein n=1 Tax=Babesia caballi TaxID=5871 RepID=A0AAV4LX85_BABCB|nr:variant erythrocyte surface antigen-1 family protein [Babesia caballi]
MTWDGVVTEFHNSYRRQLGISDRMEAQLQRIVIQQSHNFVLRELGVAATGITCECDPARKRQAANMDRGPPLKEREVHASARRPALPSAAPALAVACGAEQNELKEAIDWILRVTGKDGGGGDNGAIEALSKQAQELLQGVKVSDTKLSKDIQKVTRALTTGSDGLIGKLAEGLQHFIGYDGQTGGKIKADVGIAVSNLPVERLRDAVLMFIAPFLGVLRYHHPDLKDNNTYTKAFNEAVTACKNGVGCGQEGFEKALGTVEKELGKVGGTSIGSVLDKVKEVSEIKSNQSSVNAFATKVKEYFNGVLDKVAEDTNVKRANGQQLDTKVKELKSKLETLVGKVGQQVATSPINVGESSSSGNQSLKSDIEKVNRRGSGALAQLYQAFNVNNMYTQNRAAFALSAAAYNGANLFVTVLQTDYTSYYKGATWNQVSGNENPRTCAKMLLACLPLIFNGLSYFYWKCSHGGWRETTLGSPEPKAFMGLTSIGANRVKSGLTGSDVVSKAFKNFNEFSTAANGSTTSYADFLKTFRGNCLTNWQSSSNATASNFLSGLYLCSTSYFSHQHQKKAATARAPSSIREMLYWLMGLTATPQFGDLLGHIDKVVGNNFSVAVSGSSKTGETLSADQVTSYILATCYTCPSVLDIIQGRVPPTESNDQPWLHDLYSNSAFPFKYPSSGPALFYALSDYTYALQFQLSFLYKQCEYSYENGCGWFYCRYGSDILPKSPGNAVTSHLCEGFKCKDPLTCQHNGTNSGQSTEACNHDQDGLGQKCGKAPNNSPLQAFLIDKLYGLCRQHPGVSSHLAVCSGTTCHVPMGFEADNLRETSRQKVQGGHILNALKPFCGNSNTPLRQLCGTLICLSKRAPRSLGDLFGFYWQVTGQLFNDVKNQDNDPSSKLSDALSTLFQKLTTVKSGLLYESLTTTVESIGTHFFGLSWHCHKKDNWKTVKRSSGGSSCDDHSNSNTACDLMSLYDSECTQNKATCGKYLEPLGISSGATFANNYAFTYLSWAAYLTDELYESLQEFFEKLNIHTCKNCTHDCSHLSGTSTAACSCPSVVDCADVLPHLYAYGFSFHNAHWLRGRTYEKQHKKWSTDERLRTCKQFHSQLQSVISGEPLSNLLTSIDDFLYLFRMYFFYNLSTFWTIYICLILYTFFFMLDTLHLRSHLKLTSSHTVPPLALLTAAKPLPITKLTYIGQ